jgi:hypothetical protein
LILRWAARDSRQLKQCREQIGAGVVDLWFQTPGSGHPDQLMEALEFVQQGGPAAHPRHLRKEAANDSSVPR